MSRIYAIVADEVLMKDTVSFKFMFVSKAPYKDFMDIACRFGVLTLTPKPADFFDPFELGMPRLRSREVEIVQRWNLCVFQNGKGLLLNGGVDWDVEQSGLVKLFDYMPDFVLLTHMGALNDLKIACTKLNIELIVFRYEGILSSS